MTADARQRAVLSVGCFHRVADALVCTGFMADLTASERAAGTEAVLAAARHREAINQAQGALIAVYGLDPTASLALLMRFSQNYNMKLATSPPASFGLSSRTVTDRPAERTWTNFCSTRVDFGSRVSGRPGPGTLATGGCMSKRDEAPAIGRRFITWGLGGSDNADLLRLRALLTLGGLELHPLTFIE